MSKAATTVTKTAGNTISVLCFMSLSFRDLSFGRDTFGLQGRTYSRITRDRRIRMPVDRWRNSTPFPLKKLSSKSCSEHLRVAKRSRNARAFFSDTGKARTSRFYHHSRRQFNPAGLSGQLPRKAGRNYHFFVGGAGNLGQ